MHRQRQSASDERDGVDGINGRHRFGMGLPQMDRRECVLLDQGDIPFPRQFQAGEQGARPGRTSAQRLMGRDVLFGVRRRQELVQGGAIRERCEHGQDALPCFQRAVELSTSRAPSSNSAMDAHRKPTTSAW